MKVEMFKDDEMFENCIYASLVVFADFLSDSPGSYVELKLEKERLELGSSFGLNVVESIRYNESIQLHWLYNEDWGIRSI